MSQSRPLAKLPLFRCYTQYWSRNGPAEARPTQKPASIKEDQLPGDYLRLKWVLVGSAEPRAGERPPQSDTLRRRLQTRKFDLCPGGRLWTDTFTHWGHLCSCHMDTHHRSTSGLSCLQTTYQIVINLLWVFGCIGPWSMLKSKEEESVRMGVRAIPRPYYVETQTKPQLRCFKHTET